MTGDLLMAAYLGLVCAGTWMAAVAPGRAASVQLCPNCQGPGHTGPCPTGGGR